MVRLVHEVCTEYFDHIGIHVSVTHKNDETGMLFF
jgi:hypothetical protein